MKRNLRRRSRVRMVFAFLMCCFLMPASVNAFDFGLLLNQTLGFDGEDTEYEAALIPRFSALLGDYGSLYLSASVKAAYRNEQWNIVPELLRNEFSWRFGGSTDLSLGRMIYTDPMNLIAAGLFDGVRLSRHTVRGTFGAGVWYTGLLYKNRANIAMTDDDIASINTPFDWDDFANTYFASRRLMAALYWNHPSLADLFQFNIAMIGQMDLNDRYLAYHSQYLVMTITVPFPRFIFELGGAAEMARQIMGNESAFYTAFAADLGLHWIPPAPFHSMLSLTGRFTSGRAESGPMSAFTPITALSYGNILNAEIPGLSILSLNYMARLHHTFSAGFSASHFVRSDLGTFVAFPVGYGGSAGAANYFLGTEFFGRLMWSPLADIRMNLGGGIFLPSLGNVAPGAAPRWRVEMAVTVSLL